MRHTKAKAKTSEHCHGHTCAHRRVKFCADCRKVYCGDCRQEWVEPVVREPVSPYRFTYSPTTDQNLWPGLRQTWLGTGTPPPRPPFEVTCEVPVTVASNSSPACH